MIPTQDDECKEKCIFMCYIRKQWVLFKLQNQTAEEKLVAGIS